MDRQHALEVAMQTWWKQGLGAMSLNELCRHIGISKPALYREFGSEDGLMHAALEEYLATVVAPRFAPLRDDTSFAVALDRVITAITSDANTPTGCLLTKMRVAGEHLGPNTAARVGALIEQGRELFQRRFQAAREQGQANPEVTPELAGHFLDAQVAAVLVQMAAGEPPALVRQQARLALQALLAPGTRWPESDSSAKIELSASSGVTIDE